MVTHQQNAVPTLIEATPTQVSKIGNEDFYISFEGAESGLVGGVFLKPHSGRYVRFKTVVVDDHPAYQPISERDLTDEEQAHFAALVAVQTASKEQANGRFF
jgi:hypothetical protein